MSYEEEPGKEPVTPVEKGEEEEGELSPLEEARKLDASMKEQNEIMSKNLDRAEQLKADDLLGGTSLAGQAQVKPAEETPKEYNNRIEKEISEGMHDE